MEIFIRNKPYTGKVKAAVLDWAGTAVDYGSIGPVAVFVETFRLRGVSATVDEARTFMGLMKKDHIRGMCGLESIGKQWLEVHGKEPGENDIDAMYKDTERLMVQVIAKHSDPIPGLLESLIKLREQGVKIGTSTGYTAPMMKILAEEAAKKGYKPDAAVCSSDVSAGRPYPWMCYKNAVDLQVYPMEAMVKVGDTISDIEEGLNAGMWTVGVAKTGNELGLGQEEVEKLPADELANKLKQIEERFRKAGAHFVAEGVWGLPLIVEFINDKLSRGMLPSDRFQGGL
jgi:phosphonoacetaldehyde hydrolase